MKTNAEMYSIGLIILAIGIGVLTSASVGFIVLGAGLILGSMLP